MTETNDQYQDLLAQNADLRGQLAHLQGQLEELMVKTRGVLINQKNQIALALDMQLGMKQLLSGNRRIIRLQEQIHARVVESEDDEPWRESLRPDDD